MPKKTYTAAIGLWGESVVTVEAETEDEAREKAEEIFRAAYKQQREFPQFLALTATATGAILDAEVTHSLDTEFEFNYVEQTGADPDPRVEAMALAYMQEIYGTDDLATEDGERARDIARTMLGALDD